MNNYDITLIKNNQNRILWGQEYWLPQESFWGVWNRFHDLNASCFQNLFSQEGLFPEYRFL